MFSRNFHLEPGPLRLPGFSSELYLLGDNCYAVGAAMSIFSSLCLARSFNKCVLLLSRAYELNDFIAHTHITERAMTEVHKHRHRQRELL